MKIEKQDSYSAILIPGGPIDITNSQELKDELMVLYRQGIRKVTIDFNNVESIDSSGLGKLLLFQKKLKEKDGELKIINITSSYVKKMFSMIHLYKVMNIEGLGDS